MLKWGNLVIFFTVIYILVRGLADATKVLVIVLTITLAYHVATIMSNFIGEYAIMLAMIILVFTLGVFPVQRILQHKINEYLEIKRKRIPDKTRPEDYSFGTISFPTITSSQNIMFQVLHIVGAIGLILFLFFDPLIPFVAQYKTAGLLITLFITTYGISVLLLGYTKGMIVPIFLFSVYLALYLTNHLLAHLENNAYVLSVTLRIIALVIYAYIILKLIKKYYFKHMLCYPDYYEEGEMVGVNMNFFDYLPIIEYDTLSTFSFPIKAVDNNFASMRDLNHYDKLIKSTQILCYHHLVVFAGFHIGFNQQIMTLYFYLPKARTSHFKKRFMHLLSCHMVDNITYEQQVDEDYRVYLDELYPDDYQIQDIYAQMVYEKCIEENYDLEKKYKIQYLVSIKNDQSLDDCFLAFNDNEYKIFRSFAEDYYDEISNVYYKTLVIEHQSNIGIDRLKFNVKCILDIAQKFGGNIEYWDIVKDND